MNWNKRTVAVIIVIVVAIMQDLYGWVQTAAFLGTVIAGYFIYKMITSRWAQ